MNMTLGRHKNKQYILKWLAFSFFLLATFLRFYQLGAKSLWLDEVFTFKRASLPFAPLMAGGGGASGGHPPLYFLLTHLAMAVAPTDFGLRLPAALFGIMSVPAIGLLATSLFKKQEGLIALILFTLSPVAIHYAQEGRSYTMVMLFSMLSAFTFWEGLRRRTWRWWLALLLINIVGLYGNYLQLLFVIAELFFLTFWLIIQLPAQGKRALFYFVGTLIGMGLFIWLARLNILGVVSQVGTGATSSGSNRVWVEAWPAAKQAFDWIHLYDNLLIEYLFVSLAIIGIIKEGFVRRVMPSLFLLLLIVIPIVLILISNPSGTSIYARYFITALPFYLILVSRGIVVLHSLLLLAIQRLVGRSSSVIAPLAWAGLLGLILYPHFSALKLYYDAVPGFARHKPEWKEVVSHLEANWQPGELILTANLDTHFTFGRYMPTLKLDSLESLTQLISEQRAGYFIVDNSSRQNPWSSADRLETIEGLSIVERYPQVVLYGFNHSSDAPPAEIELKIGSPERQMFIREGWSPFFYQEEDRMYGRTQHNVSAFEVILSQGQAYTIRFTAKSLLVPQEVVINVNGEVVDTRITVNSDEWATYKVSLPASLLRAGLNKIELLHTPLEDQVQATLIGDTGVNAPRSITVDVKAHNLGNQAIIYVDGVAYSYYLAGRGYGRGYTVLALSKEGEILEWDAFDTCCGSPDESSNMSEFINRQALGTIVVIASKDDASSALTEEAVAAIKSVGGGVDLRGKFRWMHALVGVKGAAEGTAAEGISEREVTLILGKDGRKDILFFESIKLVAEAAGESRQ